LADCCFTWIVNGPEKSLAFLLADAGYDVILANNRGTSFGSKHAYLTRGDELFWQFSFDTMAKYDIPAVIDFALQLTGDDRLAYVGHSEGTTMLFAALALYPELADRLSCFVGLGPVATVGGITNPLARVMAGLRLPEWLMYFGTIFIFCLSLILYLILHQFMICIPTPTAASPCQDVARVFSNPRATASCANSQDGLARFSPTWLMT
jgi:pimeloyl-ACP methyl ester carboxylesterase